MKISTTVTKKRRTRGGVEITLSGGVTLSNLSKVAADEFTVGQLVEVEVNPEVAVASPASVYQDEG